MAPSILQVEARWPGGRVDVLHLSPRHDEVTLSDELGWHWSILGVPLGFVSERHAPWLRWSPPLLSEVVQRPRGVFLVPREHLGEPTRAVWTVREGLAVAHVDEAWSPEVCVDGRPTDWPELLRHGRASRSAHGWDVLLTRGVELRFSVGPAAFRCLEVDAVPGVGRAPAEPWLPALGLLLWGLLATVTALAPRAPHAELAEVQPGGRDVVYRAEVPPEPPRVAVTRKQVPGRPGRGGGGAAAGPQGGQGKGPDAASLTASFDTVLGALGGIPGDLVADVGRLRAGGGGPGAPGAPHLGDRRLGGGTADRLGDWPGGPHGPRPGRGDGFGDKRVDPGPPGEAEPLVLSGLTRAEVDAVIKRRLGAIRFCYTRALRADPSLAGKVILALDIARDGSVSRARVEDASLGDPSVTACIEALVYKLVFPVPRGGGTVGVRYPLLLAPMG